MVYKIFIMAAVVLGFSFTSPGSPKLQGQSDREDTVISDGYNLYDRNREGLDWNRYSYPDSGGRPQEDRTSGRPLEY